MTPIEMFGALLVGHALADYPLQGPFLSEAKSQIKPITGFPWYQALGAHAVIQGGFVAVITGIPALGVCEAIVHAGIDYTKSARRISVNVDQALHVACKLLWVLIVFFWVKP